MRFTASGDLSTILQRTRVKEGSKPQRDYNGHEQVIQVLVLQENEHTQSFKFCNYQLHTAPWSLHFDIPKQLEGWNDNLYSTTSKVRPCKPTIGGLYRFSRGHFQVPSVRFRGWINRSSLTSPLPTQVTCNRISPPVVPAADVQAPTELASSQLPSCHRNHWRQLFSRHLNTWKL